MVIQAYAPNSNAEETEVEQFYEDLQELTPKKDVLFIIGDWNAKVGSQEILGATDKFGFGVQNEAGERLTRVLPREHTGHSKHLLPTTQEKALHMDITRYLYLSWLLGFPTVAGRRISASCFGVRATYRCRHVVGEHPVAKSSGAASGHASRFVGRAGHLLCRQVLLEDSAR